MAKTKTKYKYRTKSKKSRRHGKPAIHIVPAALEVAGLALPVFSQTNTGDPSPWDSAVKYRNGPATAGNLLYNIKTEWEDMAILVGGGILAKYIGKKTGLNRLGTKEFKLF